MLHTIARGQRTEIERIVTLDAATMVECCPALADIERGFQVLKQEIEHATSTIGAEHRAPCELSNWNRRCPTCRHCRRRTRSLRRQPIHNAIRRFCGVVSNQSYITPRQLITAPHDETRCAITQLRFPCNPGFPPSAHDFRQGCALQPNYD